MVYGDYCTPLSCEYPHIRAHKQHKYIEVDPDSVKQLIGHDINGREVYEGDILVDHVGTEYIARLEPYIATADQKYYYCGDADTLALKGGDISDRSIR